MVGKEKKYECDVCGEKFKTLNALGAHRYHKHKIDIERVDTNALLDLLRGIRADIKTLKQKEVIGVKDAQIKEGYDEISDIVADSLSTVLKRVDALEKKLGVSEDGIANNQIDSVSMLLNRIDRLEGKAISSGSNELIKDEEALRNKLNELLPMIEKHGLEVVITNGEVEVKKSYLSVKKDRGFLDYPTDEELSIEEADLRKALDKLIPSMVRFNLEIRQKVRPATLLGSEERKAQIKKGS